jgi:hypothetical protein
MGEELNRPRGSPANRKFTGAENTEWRETPVGLPEVSAKGCRRKSLIPCNVKNYDKAIFSMEEKTPEKSAEGPAAGEGPPGMNPGNMRRFILN